MGKLSRMILVATFSTGLLSLLPTVANATHATLKVVNDSSSSIIQFYAAPYWTKRYGSDRLGTYIIRPGQYWYVDLSDGETDNCLYDVKVILKNGQIFEDRLDVCNGTLNIYDK